VPLPSRGYRSIIDHGAVGEKCDVLTLRQITLVLKKSALPARISIVRPA
jgi:hypothetical protein